MRTFVYRHSLPWLTRHSSRVFGFLLLCSALVTLGCGKDGGGAAKNEVTGKVTLGDKPVSGIVTFVYGDGREMSGPTGPDGTYTIIDAQPGAVKIYVKALPGPAGVGAKAPKGGPDMPVDGPKSEVGGGVPPPAKFTTVATSGLTYEVKAGKQTFDIPLK